jgi:hypothetical protein
MTANKNFKRRVRERARRTGESYTAALSHLRRIAAKESSMQWQRVERPEYGYAVHIPQGWEEREANLKNSPWEVARYVEPGDRRHMVGVFKPFRRPGRTAAELATGARSALEGSGFSEFSSAPATLGGVPAVQLSCVKRDAGRVWAVRELFAVQGETELCLGFGTAAPDEDDPIFEAMAERFEILAQP